MAWRAACCAIAALLAFTAAPIHPARAQTPLPTLSPGPATRPTRDEWADAESGCRVERLTRFPGLDCGPFYFHQVVFTAQGDKTVFAGYTDRATRRLYCLDLTTRQALQLTTSGTDAEALAPKSRTIYYIGGGGKILGTNIDTGQTRAVAQLPRDWDKGCRLSVNADETLLAASATIRGTGAPPATNPARGPSKFNDTFDAKQTNVLFTVDLKTAQVREIHRINTWLGHVQFSPTDPTLMMYCHEGPWAAVDRIWLIRVDGSEPWCAFKREQPTEIAGHEFWHPDGKSVWFDNNVRGTDKAFLACVDISNGPGGKLTRYPLPAELASAHFNWSPDGTFIANEGNPNSKWVHALRIVDGKIVAQRLVSMKDHDYKAELNVHVSPDSKRILFGSAMQGTSEIYWVQVPATK